MVTQLLEAKANPMIRGNDRGIAWRYAHKHPDIYKLSIHNTTDPCIQDERAKFY
jgi:hypothetical protein